MENTITTAQAMIQLATPVIILSGLAFIAFTAKTLFIGNQQKASV